MGLLTFQYFSLTCIRERDVDRGMRTPGKQVSLMSNNKTAVTINVLVLQGKGKNGEIL